VVYPVSEQRAAGGGAAAGEIALSEAARRLGVHYMTAYRYVRTGQLSAARRNGRWLIAEDDLQAFASSRSKRRPHDRAGGATPGSPSSLVQRLLQGDEGGCWQLLQTAAEHGRSPQELLTALLAPAMKRIGDRWEAGDLTVADEHRASAVALRLLARVAPMCLRPGRPRGDVLLACVPGEQHSLPPAIVAAIVRGAGYHVVELGADTPLEALHEAVLGRNLLAAGLSVASHDRLPACRLGAEVVRSAAPATLLMIGGPAVTTAQQAQDLGADRWAADAHGVVTALEEMRVRGARSVAWRQSENDPQS
jgi:excisionase family DNA binding protein